MRIPGIVDVYQVGDQWVARSWPKQANQPNSPAQLLWRQKFADAHKCISSFQGTFLNAWKGIECPPGKMWIDIAIHSYLVYPYLFSEIPSQKNCKFACYFSPNGFDIKTYHRGEQYGLWLNQEARQFWDTWIGKEWTPGSSWKDVYQWDNVGWICPKGKRPKIKWMLMLKRKQLLNTWADLWFINGQWCTIWLFPSLPAGVTISRWNTVIMPGDGSKDYCLSVAPVYCPLQPWEGSFTP